jgi:hypothetical protein
MQLLQARGHVVHTGRQANHSIPAFPAAGAKGADTHGPNCDGRTYDSSSDLNHGRGKTYEQRIDPDSWRYRPWPRRFLRPLALLLTELPMLVFLKAARETCSTLAAPVLDFAAISPLA